MENPISSLFFFFLLYSDCAVQFVFVLMAFFSSLCFDLFSMTFIVVTNCYFFLIFDESCV
jgi:hypothetical protein